MLEIKGLFSGTGMDFDYYKFRRALQTVEPYVSGSRWLELGCHNARFAVMLAERGFDVTGVDVYDPSLKGQNTWDYKQHNLNSFPYPFTDNSFDIISGLEIIEHIIDTDRFLSEAHRILKPNGALLLTTPNINMLRNRFRVPLGKYPYGLEYRNDIHHVRLYNVSALRSQLAEHGFIVHSISGLNLLPIKSHRIPVFETLSRVGASVWPSGCSDLILVATLQDRA
jgi:2-polyprenyl-3-methyl-5-hydroxy-6-metoxy-1,4-benzoquinol methylase